MGPDTQALIAKGAGDGTCERDIDPAPALGHTEAHRVPGARPRVGLKRTLGRLRHLHLPTATPIGSARSS